MKGKLVSINVLLVEDNDDDIIIIEKAFSAVKFVRRFYVVHNGEEALDFIYHRGKYKEIQPSIPELIFLDISMPGMNGFEVLEELKTDSKTKKIPVIMLTSSKRKEDVEKSYGIGAYSYITKPSNLNDLTEFARHFEIIWRLILKKYTT